MGNFKDIAKKSFAKKFMGDRMIGVIGLKIIQEFFNDPNLEGFIKFNYLHIKTQNQEIKIKAFRYKKEILDKINDALADYGYKRKITDIRF
ncbi:MAG TPA: hypothetical protein PLP73_00440 [Candidatus Absconditabacterales bacterium]|nr:hypothetical protein [Candidatus Absconditabacterales bacterium]HRU49891.1 hypothetical protein [Candidatus Absconditabacterales bacterium]